MELDSAEAFQSAKDSVTTSQVLTHYNTKLPIKMAADASAYGIGAVVSHVLPDGLKIPIALRQGLYLIVNATMLNWRKKHLL